MGTTLGISWSYDIFSIWPRCIFDLKSFNCSFLDPDGFDPWISLVHSLILMGTTLGISLVTLGISWISLILGSILGISLFMGTTLGISWSYDIFSIWPRCIFDLKSLNCSFLDPDGFDPWISLVHSLILMGSISKNSRSRNEPVVKKAGKEQ